MKGTITGKESGGHSAAPLRFPVDEADTDDVHRMLSHFSNDAVSSVDTPPELPVYALPDEEYLEVTILPLLLRALEELAKVRPPDPLAFLAAYLLGNNPQRRSVPLLHNADGRKVPLIELAHRAAMHFSATAQAGAASPETSNA